MMLKRMWQRNAKLQDLIDEAMSPQKVVPPDLKVDDRDLPEAPKFLYLVHGPSFPQLCTIRKTAYDCYAFVWRVVLFLLFSNCSIH